MVGGGPSSKPSGVTSSTSAAGGSSFTATVTGHSPRSAAGSGDHGEETTLSPKQSPSQGSSVMREVDPGPPPPRHPLLPAPPSIKNHVCTSVLLLVVYSPLFYFFVMILVSGAEMLQVLTDSGYQSSLCQCVCVCVCVHACIFLFVCCMNVYLRM